MSKIYKLSQTINRNYDSYDSCIVCAKNKRQAKTFAPDGRHIDWHRPKYFRTTWVSDVNDITCEYIGKAHKDIKLGVIVASFNTG